MFALLAGGLTYRYWPSDERDIKRHLSNLAEAMSTPAEGENEAMHLTRMGAIAEYFAPDVQVRFTGGTLTSRERVLAAIERASYPGRISVRVDTVLADIKEARAAQVSLTAKVARLEDAGREPRLEVRHARIAMLKMSGDWVITAVEEGEPPPHP
jgi:hypothetical protein